MKNQRKQEKYEFNPAGGRLPEFPPLRGDVKTEILIVGGGMAGLLTAYHLHRKGVSHVLVEKVWIASGTPVIRPPSGLACGLGNLLRVAKWRL